MVLKNSTSFTVFLKDNNVCFPITYPPWFSILKRPICLLSKFKNASVKLTVTETQDTRDNPHTFYIIVMTQNTQNSLFPLLSLLFFVNSSSPQIPKTHLFCITYFSVRAAKSLPLTYLAAPKTYYISSGPFSFIF